MGCDDVSCFTKDWFGRAREERSRQLEGRVQIDGVEGRRRDMSWTIA
jgi:hypothetical protein